MKPLELQQALGKGQIAPLYLLYGEETFLIDATVDDLKKRLIDPRLSSFNLSVFHGGECQPHHIISAAQTLPLMSRHRMVVVKEADQIKSSWKDFSHYFEQPLPTTCLIFCSGSSTLKSELLSLFKKRGTVVRFYHPFTSEMPSWIRKCAKERNKQMSREAVALLSEVLENDLQRIYNEMEKIALYVGQRSTIEREDVQAVIAVEQEMSIFKLTDCLAGKDRARALDALQSLLHQGEHPLKILSMIARHYRLMVRANEMVQKGLTPPEAGKKVGINDFHLKVFVKQVQAFSPDRAQDCFGLLFKSDRKLKSSRISERIILEDMISRLCAL